MLRDITKPTLIVNKQTCIANIRRMAAKAKASGVIFRPHFKTHQSLEVAKWFREFEVEAITVSSVSMAKEFANDGWNDITIAFPVNVREMNDYRSLSAMIRLNLILDSVEVLNILSSAIEVETGIFIEIDTGYGRSGVYHSNYKQIEQIIKTIDQAEKLSFKGFLTHSGNTYTVGNKGEIENIYNETLSALHKLRNKYPGALISIGDTPSCSVLNDLSGADEIRPGNFVYNDLMQYYLGSCSIEDIAVTVACPVTNIFPERNEIVIYGGAVHMSKESLEKDGKYFGLVVKYTESGTTEPIPDTRLISISQEHGLIHTTSEFISSIRHGDLLGILPVHSCLTANLLKNDLRIRE